MSSEFASCYLHSSGSVSYLWDSRCWIAQGNISTQSLWLKMTHFSIKVIFWGPGPNRWLTRSQWSAGIFRIDRCWSAGGQSQVEINKAEEEEGEEQTKRKLYLTCSNTRCGFILLLLPAWCPQPPPPLTSQLSCSSSTISILNHL